MISGGFFLKTIFIKKNIVYYAWTGLLILNILGFVFTGNISDELHINMLKNTLFLSLAFYPYYFLAYENQITSDDLILFLKLILPVFILSYFNNASMYMENTGRDENQVVNNASYFFCTLLPFVFLVKKKKYAWLFIFILFFFIISGSKRGALLVGAVGYLGYMRFYLKDNRGLFVKIVFVSIVMVSVFILIQSQDFLNDRLHQMSTGDSSGRDAIFLSIVRGWHNGSFFNLLFGFGFAQSVLLTGGNYAHNDWLELLSNFGLLGISVYLFLFYSFLKFSYNQKYDNYKTLFMTITMMWFLGTCVNMVYISSPWFPVAMLIGYLTGINGCTKNPKKRGFKILPNNRRL